MSSITIPWGNIVQRADPDRLRDLAKEPQYEFSKGKTFTADGRRTGVYAAAAPAFLREPTITGALKVGAALRCEVTPDMYIGAPEPSVLRQWKADGVDMPGEIDTFLTTLPADAGVSLTCFVTLTNASGSVTTTTTAVLVVA